MTTLQGLRTLGEQTGSPELLGELVEMFLADVPTRVTGLRAALEKGDGLQARAVAHALKGSAGQLGALRLASVAETIEHECASGQLDDARGRLDAIDASFDEAKGAFRELLKSG